MQKPPTLVSSEGLCPSDSPTRALTRRSAGALRSRGSLAALARIVAVEGLCPSDSPTRALTRRSAGALRSRGSLAALARIVAVEGLCPSDSPTRALARRSHRCCETSARRGEQLRLRGH